MEFHVEILKLLIILYKKLKQKGFSWHKLKGQKEKEMSHLMELTISIQI